MSEQKPRHFPMRAWRARDALIVAAASAAVRLALLERFGTVTYDGTFYLGEARALLQAGALPGAFPLGYPVAAAVLHLIARDWVVAGQWVSLIAGVAGAAGLVLVARRFVSRGGALLCGMAFALHPLAVRLSVSTMSESLYLSLLILGLAAFVAKRDLASGALLGLAVATRPEGLAVVAGLAVLTGRRWRRAGRLIGGVALVFVVHAAILSYGLGRTVVLPKSEAFGQSAGSWKLREAQVDFEGRDETFGDLEAAASRTSLLADYMERLPRDMALLARHATPVVLGLALLGIVTLKWNPLICTLLFLPLFPLFTPRSEARFVLPYIPFLFVYAVAGVERIRPPTYRAIGYGLLIAAVLAGPFWNRHLLRNDVDPGLAEMREAAETLGARIRAGDGVADRKPYLAFYAGGSYIEIPVAPYEDAMRYLIDADVQWLALHRGTIHVLRPALRPLMYSAAVMNGELRFEQVYFKAPDQMVFRRVRDSDPVRWTRLARTELMPAWSPLGGALAFRSRSSAGTGAIRLLNRSSGSTKTIADVDDVLDPLAWSADGSQIAFAVRSERGDVDMMSVDVRSGTTRSLISDPSDDRSPSWLSDRVLVYVSNRSGSDELWSRDVATGEDRRLTSGGGHAFPSASPDGKRIAWIREGEGVRILDIESGDVTQVRAPRQVGYAPAWSPDGRYIAMTAWDWGSSDIYVARSDGSAVLLLTKTDSREGMPAWHPDGSRMALISDRDGGEFSVWTLDGIEPYLRRLDDEVPLQTFRAP